MLYNSVELASRANEILDGLEKSDITAWTNAAPYEALRLFCLAGYYLNTEAAVAEKDDLLKCAVRAQTYMDIVDLLEKIKEEGNEFVGA